MTHFASGLKAEVKKITAKIYVSHRIDVDSVILKDDIYCPVRCGAVFDKRNNDSSNNICGDDTGANISKKRNMYGELTVQYWAWKNQDVDYYGLCHYRRYLSFADTKRMKKNCFDMVSEVAITSENVKKHRLNDNTLILENLAEYRMIVGKGAFVGNIEVKGGKPSTVRELWEAHDGIFIEKKYIARLFDRIRTMRPEYLQYARDYFDSDTHYGFNCFVMDKELFNGLCEFQFPILFSLEQEVVKENYSGMMVRTLGYLGEMLYGIYVYATIQNKNVKVGEKNIVLFMTTTKVHGKKDYCLRWLKTNTRNYLADNSLRLLPRGSRRRRAVKKVLGIR